LELLVLTCAQFNAGCERFIRDWRNTEVHVSVRDARIHEDDPLLGVVYLPLGKMFSKRAQISDYFPLAGGVGFGRVRISMVFRAVQLQAPPSLRGWEYGTLEVHPEIRAEDLPEDLKQMRLKVRTTLGRGKFRSHKDGTWKQKHDESVNLAVRKRYSNCTVVEFRKDSALLDKTPAFAILWLKDIPDNEEQVLTLPVWKGDLKRAEANVLPESGEKVGSIKMTVRFWSGLSAFHAKLARNDANIHDVMEVLDVTKESAEANEVAPGMVRSESDSSSDSDHDSQDRADLDSEKQTLSSGISSSQQGDEKQDGLQEDGKRGPIDAMKEYKKHAKQLHRKNKGIMQWKVPRTLHWVKHKAEHTEQKVVDMFKHHERDTGVETEV